MENLTEWKSTITGIVTIILSVLVGFGVLSAEESGQVASLGTQVLEGVAGVIGGVAGLYQLFFQKD